MTRHFEVSRTRKLVVVSSYLILTFSILFTVIDAFTKGAVEFTTPILKYNASESWRRDVQGLWTFLDDNMLIETHAKCGTHVHMSPLEGIWPLMHLKKICRCVLWFENAFEVLVPESRRGNHYCKSNQHDNPKFLDKSLQQCLGMIDECQSNQDVVDLMNNDGDRYYAWNFVNLYYGGKNTIEFRRGPGAEDDKSCFAWVELAVSFVQAAIKLGSITGLEMYEKKVEDLLRFIRAATVPRLNRPEAMRQIFSGKAGTMLPKKVGTLSTGQLAVLQRKKSQDGKKNLMLKKYQTAED